MRPLLRGAIAAVALSLAPVAVVTTASPASAAADVSTSSTFGSAPAKRALFGDPFFASGNVEAADGSIVDVGVKQLQRRAKGSDSWKTVATDDLADDDFGGFDEYDKHQGNATFRVAYTGGVDGETTYLPSVSTVITVKVFRNFTGKDVSKRVPAVKVKFSPKFGNKQILVQKKQGKKWKTFKKVKTNKKGQALVSGPGSSKGIKYRLVAPGNKQFTTTKAFFTAYRY